jgi:Na+/phosphate symporter
MNQGVMILNALSPLIVKNILSLINLATLSTSESFIGILSITLLGTFSNALIQSTNINLELVNTYMDQQKIAAEEGIAFMLGSNLGLTIIPLLAAVTLHKKSARKVAYAYLVSISHTTLIVLLFYKSFISLIATIAVYISRLPTASLIVKTGYMSFVLFNAVLWFLLRDLLVLVVKGFKRHQHDKQLHLRDIVLALPEYAREFFFEFAEQLEMAIRQVRYNLDYLVNAVEIGSTVNYTEFSKHLDDLAISLTQAENSLNALIIYARQTRTYPRALTYYIQIFSTLNSIKGISEAIEKQVPHIGQVSNPVTLQELQKIKKDYQNALSSLFDYLHVNYNPEEYTEEHRVNATNHLTIVRLETYLHQIKIIIDDLVKS